MQYGRRAVLLDPLSEEAHCLVLRLLIASGRPAEALRQFQELERVLREQINSVPSAEAQAIADDLTRSIHPAGLGRDQPMISRIDPHSLTGGSPGPVTVAA